MLPSLLMIKVLLAVSCHFLIQLSFPLFQHPKYPEASLSLQVFVKHYQGESSTVIQSKNVKVN